MIKNLLYSLFLHFLLLLVIYANFNLKTIEVSKSSEVAVSLITMSGNEISNSNKSNSFKSEKQKKDQPKIKKEVIKKAKSEQESPKNNAKKQSKKLASSKPLKSIAKTIDQEKIQEFKQQPEPEEKQEEATKIKEDKIINKDQSPDQNENLRKEKDFGTKETSKEEQESNDEESDNKDNSVDTANNLENMDLSAREKLNIQSQLKRCYRKAVDETKIAGKTKFLVKVRITENGYIDSDLENLVDTKLYNDPSQPSYKATIDNVRRALDLCSPLRNLPLDKYDIWKEVVLEFGDDEAAQ